MLSRAWGAVAVTERCIRSNLPKSPKPHRPANCWCRAFIVRGQRQWYKDIDLRIGLALVAINGVPLLGTTPEHAQLEGDGR